MNRMALCDCFEGMRGLPDKCVDMVLCDLPYGTTQNKWDSPLSIKALWEDWARTCKPSAAVVLTCTHPFTYALMAAALHQLEYEWIWHKSSKTGHLNAHKRPMRVHENVLVFRTAGAAAAATYNPQGLQPYRAVKRRGHNGTNFGVSGSENWQEWTNYPSTILHIANESKPVHPTQKLVALFEYLIRTYTNPGGVVLDCCGGSGTTAVAAIRSGRQFIVFEKDPVYFAAAAQRVMDAFKVGAVDSAITP